jgi:hypothetical protein
MIPAAYTLDTLGLPPRNARIPDPAGAAGRRVAREVMSRDVPGHPLDDRRNQAAHYTSLPYLCIEQIAKGISGGTVRITQKRKRRQSVSTTADPKVYKALPTPHSQADDEEYVPAPDGHELVRLFEYVNEVDTLGDFLTDWVVNEELHGEAVIWPVKDADGYPAELWVIPSASCTPLTPGVSQEYPCGGVRVWGWQAGMSGVYGLSGGYFQLDNRELFRPRKRHPLYRQSGYSPMTAGARELDVLESINEARKKHMDAGFAPDTVVAVKGASLTELERLQKDFENRFLGSRGRRVIFTDGESVTADKLVDGARDMDYPSGWDQMTKFVCALWQTGSGVMGLTDAESYASFYAKLKQHHTLCLGPKARRMGEFLTKHLARPYWPQDRLCVEIDLPAIDDADVMDRHLQNDGQLGVRTVNEIRGARSLDPLPGGDVPPAIFLARLTGEQQQQLQQSGIAAGLLPDPTKVPEPAVAPPGGPPRPDNPDGEGSLPAQFRKSVRRILKSLK